MTVTINDVSRRAGVSRSTVSRVVADNGYVSEAKRKAIEAAIAELGYRPNTLAQALRSNRSNMIGGVVPDVGTPFYANMVAGIQAGCRAGGKSLMVSSGFADQDEEAKAIVELIDRSCDGLVLYLENPIRPDVMDIIRNERVPVVTIGGGDCAAARAQVRIDNFGGAVIALRHLLEMGHRSIVHFTGQMAYRDTRERLRGIASVIAEYSLRADAVHIIEGAYSEEFGYDATLKLIASGRQFTAIFAGDDDLAAGALLALKRSGRRVPEDVSLIGFDDNFHARHMTPGLTTMRQPVGEAGHRAAQMLLRILGNEPLGSLEDPILTSLVLRDSVARIAA